MAERKGINSIPLDSGKLNLDKIPKLGDFLGDFLTDFNCQKDVPQLVLVIKAADGSKSLSSSHGTVAKKFF